MSTTEIRVVVSEDDRAAFRAGPVDEQSQQRLAANGLAYRRVPVDSDAFGPWLQSVARGFQDSERSDEHIASARERTSP